MREKCLVSNTLRWRGSVKPIVCTLLAGGTPFQTPYGGGGLLNGVYGSAEVYGNAKFQTPYGGGGLLNVLL